MGQDFKKCLITTNFGVLFIQIRIRYKVYSCNSCVLLFLTKVGYITRCTLYCWKIIKTGLLTVDDELR